MFAAKFSGGDDWDAWRLQLAQGVFGISDIRRIRGGLRDSSGISNPDRLFVVSDSVVV